ncbi:MAG: VapE family protein [Bacteroidales bacterium]|nr:VapE family protein [Bacteroidales bacterium]MDD3555995.1 VapE family protein [Proteiniphilum sp.]MDD2771563.1 VapE family protein [Bacteroidales bacterium]MDD3105875.1 VapE family protein [Bacteroidales bacterium]MDD5345391.1 VapE family protein [Proteiniphilum sp.]
MKKGNKSCNEPATATGKQSKNERIEAFLRERYDFRFNTVKSRTEFRPSGTDELFTPLTKFDINSIRRLLDASQGFNTSAENIRSILESDFCPKINPVQEYFRLLPRLHAEDNSEIYRLSECVSLRNPKKWQEYLLKWLVAVVANAMDDFQCRNHTCLVLAGEQGKFKTTFLDLLCPASLKSYLFTGKIDPQGKDIQTLIAECLLINIDDQLKSLNKRDENELKNLITTPRVKYRRPYDVYIEEYPHLASFMASVNGSDFLTDPTGSRRFLPFEVVSIDLEAARRVDMDRIYAEAVWYWENGYRYWFNEAEIAELHHENEAFHVQTAEYEMLLKGFEKPEEGAESFMTTSEILTYLRGYTNLNLQEKRMGEALKKAGFERKSRRVAGSPMYVYHIRKITPNPFTT